MNSASLAPVHPGVPQIIPYPTHSIYNETYSCHENVTEMIREFQLSTGMSQTEKREFLYNPATPWFDNLWTKAIKANTESAWHLFPEEVFEQIEECGKTLETSDLGFLGYAAVETYMPTMAAIAAIRLMGILAEDGYLRKSAVLPYLRDALSHPNVQRRYYGAKAIWQAKARDGLDALQRRLERETSERVKAVIERAIRVLE